MRSAPTLYCRLFSGMDPRVALRLLVDDEGGRAAETWINLPSFSPNPFFLFAIRNFAIRFPPRLLRFVHNPCQSLLRERLSRRRKCGGRPAYPAKRSTDRGVPVGPSGVSNVSTLWVQALVADADARGFGRVGRRRSRAGMRKPSANAGRSDVRGMDGPSQSAPDGRPQGRTYKLDERAYGRPSSRMNNGQTVETGRGEDEACAITDADSPLPLRTPLCPAGHLPLKGGDWLASPLPQTIKAAGKGAGGTAG